MTTYRSCVRSWASLNYLSNGAIRRERRQVLCSERRHAKIGTAAASPNCWPAKTDNRVGDLGVNVA
jgi:hypothetical protein